MRRALLVAVLLVVGACGDTRPERASGVTERWLQAISDSGRVRVRDDALVRAGRDGKLDVLLDALPVGAGGHDDEDLFADLEVGRAVEDHDEARVPFRVTMGDDDAVVHRTAVLARREGGWGVVGVEESRDGELVPSSGGDRPSTATGRHWLAASAVGLLVTVLSALVIEIQPERPATRRLGGRAG